MNSLKTLFILDEKENIIFEYHWHGRTSKNIIALFISEYKKATYDKDIPTPIIPCKDGLLFHIDCDNIIFFCVVTSEIDPLYVIEFLYHIINVLKDYLGQNAIKKSILEKKNEIVIQLLNEMIDYGYPMITESNTLKDIVPLPNTINQILNMTGLQKSYIPQGILSPIAWRRANVKHIKNEFFIDIVEELTGIIDKHGRFITLFSKGKIKCLSNISGVPNIILTIKSKYDIFYSSFHPCVLSSHIPSLKRLCFVPPDGKFTLMTYGIELSDKISSSLPISIEPKSGPNIEDFEIKLNIFNQFIDNITITIPISESCRVKNSKSTHGNITIEYKHKEKNKLIVWTLDMLKACSFASMKFTLDEMKISPNYLVAKFTCNEWIISNIKVESLKITSNPNTKHYRGIRYITIANEIVVRF
ncbi:hypothetical protein PMAC_002182 [Pneumocystis sp. 'macacae']|nr:hypothetical protein PMAC_002182 [Pneumocystis sp. 'macacae']